MGKFAGLAVEEEADDEFAARVAKAGGGLRAAVAEGVAGGVRAVLVGNAGAVVVGVEDESQAPIDGFLEGEVVHADALPRYQCGDGFGPENLPAVELAGVAEHFVKVGEFLDGAAARSGGRGRLAANSVS